MYLGLTFLACWSMHAEIKYVWYYLIVIFSVSWGTMMEIFQYLMHLGRSFDLYDIVGNSVGTILGVLVYIMMARLKVRLDLKTTKIV